jgi:hypothetical protein
VRGPGKAAPLLTLRCWVRRQGKGKGKWKQENAGGADAEFDEWRARTQPGELCLQPVVCHQELCLSATSLLVGEPSTRS